MGNVEMLREKKNYSWMAAETGTGLSERYFAHVNL